MTSSKDIDTYIDEYLEGIPTAPEDWILWEGKIKPNGQKMFGLTFKSGEPPFILAPSPYPIVAFVETLKKLSRKKHMVNPQNLN